MGSGNQHCVSVGVWMNIPCSRAHAHFLVCLEIGMDAHFLFLWVDFFEALHSTLKFILYVFLVTVTLCIPCLAEGS